MSLKRIYIQRTAGEWNVINEEVKKLGKQDLHTYLHCGISRLKRIYQECPDCITPAQGEITQKSHQLPDELYEILEKLSQKMKKPISSIVDDLLITPLLRPRQKKDMDPAL